MKIRKKWLLFPFLMFIITGCVAPNTTFHQGAINMQVNGGVNFEAVPPSIEQIILFGQDISNNNAIELYEPVTFYISVDIATAIDFYIHIEDPRLEYLQRYPAVEVEEGVWEIHFEPHTRGKAIGYFTATNGPYIYRTEEFQFDIYSKGRGIEISHVVIGDQVGDMIVSDIILTEDQKTIQNIAFTGQVEVTGVYWYDPLSSPPHEVIFKVSDSSINRLPVLKNAELQSVWFMFTNDEVAREAFALVDGQEAKGEATIEINHYVLTNPTYENWNKATLVRVLEQSADAE